MSVLASHTLRSEGVPGLRDWVVVSEQNDSYTTSENLRISVRLICWNQMAYQ